MFSMANGTDDALLALEGSSGNDNLIGTSDDELLRGQAGDDKLNGGAGNDVLVGGAGRDTLTGGDGADTFRFSELADSYRTSSTLHADLITDFDGALDRLDLSGLGFSALGNGYNGTLLLSYSSTSDRTYLKSFEADASGNRFELALHGNQLTALNHTNILFSANALANNAPALSEPLLDQSLSENTSLTYGISTSSFADADGDSLSYSATLSSGAALPSWLAFNATTLTFNGMPGLGTAGTYEIRLSASDGRGGTLTDSFLISISAAPEGELTLWGSEGNDRLLGTSADETLQGMAGIDTLLGGAGNDLLIGGGGRDSLTGGDGADTFRFSELQDSYRNGSLNNDTITDFDAALEG